MDRILRLTFAEPDRQAVQDEAAAAVERDPEPLLARYRALPNSFGGRYVCADLFKELFPAFAASPEARNRYNGPVHNAAAVLSAEQFRRNLADPSLGGEGVIFLTGVPGAGKTSSVLRPEQPWPARARMIFEGQMVKPETSFPKIQAVLDAGLAPSIVVVHVRPETALERTFARFATEGRGASKQVMAMIQGGQADGLQAISDRFGDAVALTIFDRRNPDAPGKSTEWENLDVLRSEGNREQIERRLEAAIDEHRRAGRIDDAAWRQASGLAPAPERGRGVGGQPDRVGPADGPRPGLSQEGHRPDELRSQRLVVLGGEAAIQQQGADGRWTDISRRPVGDLPAGNWSLNVREVHRGGEAAGPVLHVDARSVYQLVNDRVIRHERSGFDQTPEIGQVVRIARDGPRLRVEPARDLGRSRGRGR